MPQTPTTALTFSDAHSGVLSWPVESWAVALQPPTVLITEADAAARDLIAGALSAAGYRPLVTDNGRAAMALAVNEHPQLILLDLSMPGLDALGFCYELHSSPQTAHIPVIISGRDAPSDVDLGRMVGAEDYLVKPFTPTELLRRVRHLVPVIGN